MSEATPASAPNRSGALTTAMRAMPLPRGPRVLRIGVLRANAIVEERMLAPRAPLTIGTNERATVTLSARGLALRATLIEPTRDGYVLAIARGMTARVAMAGRTIELDGACATRLTLGDDARGMIGIGDTTILFQMALPIPARAKAALPTSVRQGLASDIDWPTTVIACFSFLLHFGAVGALYSDWMDPTIDDGVSLGQLVDTLASLPTPPPVETSTEPSENASTSTTAAPVVAPNAPRAPRSGGEGAPRGGGPTPTMSDANAHGLSKELAALDLGMVGVLNAQGSSTRGVLGRDDLPTSILDKTGASEAGVGDGPTAGLNLGGGTGSTHRPGEASGGFGTIGNTTSYGPITPGTASPVAHPPRPSVTAGVVPTGGDIGNAGKVVAGMSPGFRRCYQSALNEDQTMKGTMRITAHVGPNGDVTSVTPFAVSGLSPSMVACVARRVQSATFDKPEGGGGGTIVIPLGFYAQ